MDRCDLAVKGRARVGEWVAVGMGVELSEWAGGREKWRGCCW